MFSIRGFEYDVSFTDADVIERYESAAYKMKEAVADRKRFGNMSTADAVREQCRIMNDFIDETLDDKTASDRIFSGKYDLLEHINACEEINEAAAAARKAVADITNKYTQKQRSFQVQNGGKNYGNHGKGGNR